MTQKTPAEIISEIEAILVSGVSTTEVRDLLLEVVDAVDVRIQNDVEYIYITPTQRIGKGASTTEDTMMIQRFNADTEEWEAGDLEVGHDSLTIGSTILSQYGKGIAYKSPLNNIGRVVIANLDADGIGSSASVKIGTSREDSVLQPVTSDVFAGTNLLIHLNATADSVINSQMLKSGSTIPDKAVVVNVYQGWRTQAEIDASPDLNIVYHSFIDASDFGVGLDIDVDIAQRLEFDLGDEYTVHIKTAGLPFSTLGDSSITNPFLGGTQFVPYFEVNRTLQSSITFGDDSLYARKTNVLELDNTDVFVPDADYEPATKKYVDDNVQTIPDLATKANVLELDNTDTFTPSQDYHPATKTYVDTMSLSNSVTVKTSADFGSIDSSKVYIIDGIIDMTGVSIEIPSGGINIVGSTFDVSQLICSDNSYDMFYSAIGGSGNVLVNDVGFTVDGNGSQVWNLVGFTGTEAFEFTRVNYNNCSKVGIISTYRQGLELGTGRFGGFPTLELVGTWIGGYRITTSIVRGLDAGMTAPLFKAGAGFSMESRFLTDINCDLPALASLADFVPSSFANSSSLQIVGALISRDGVFDPSDSNIFPNISASDVKSSFRDNSGVNNTFVGGRATLDTESTTAITQNVWSVVSGTFIDSELQHFDSFLNGQLRHLATTPRDYRVTLNSVVDGTDGDEISIKLSRYDNSSTTFIDVPNSEQTRFIQNSQGASDIAYFSIACYATLDLNDYLRMEITNLSNNNDVTIMMSTFYLIEAR